MPFILATVLTAGAWLHGRLTTDNPEETANSLVRIPSFGKMAATTGVILALLWGAAKVWSAFRVGGKRR